MYSAKNAVAEIDLDEIPEESLMSHAGAGSGAYKTLGCCWCLPWYSSWTRCGIACAEHETC